MTYLVGISEVPLSLCPLLCIEADISQAQEAFQLHAARFDLRCNQQTAFKLSLCVVELSLQQVPDGQLAVCQAHAFEIISRLADGKSLLELKLGSFIFTHQP